jgi:hypothetical protein
MALQLTQKKSLGFPKNIPNQFPKIPSHLELWSFPKLTLPQWGILASIIKSPTKKSLSLHSRIIDKTLRN